MKLSISTLSCPEWPIERIVETCVAHGIAGVDFRGLGPDIDITRSLAFTTALDHTLELFRARGLAIACFNTSVTLVSPGPQRWQDMLDEAHRHAVLADRTGTRLMRIFGGVIPKGMNEDEGLAMAQRHLRQVIKICRPHGLLPLIETHDACATSAAVRQLLHEFSPDEVGVLWDVDHTTRAGESPADAVAALARYLKHVHFKDTVRVDGKSIPKLLGEGDLPLKGALGALNRIDYQGWLCLEVEKRWHESAPDPEQAIPQYAQFMKQF